MLTIHFWSWLNVADCVSAHLRVGVTDLLCCLCVNGDMGPGISVLAGTFVWRQGKKRQSGRTSDCGALVSSIYS